MPDELEETAPTEDTAALKALVTKLRKQNDQYTARLKAFDDDKALSEKTLLEQVEMLKQEKTTLQTAAQQREAELTQALSQTKVSYQFTDALSEAKILPEYRDRFSDVAAVFSLGEDNISRNAEGKTDRQVVQELRVRYPAMFAPEITPNGGGAPGNPAITPTSQARIIKASDTIAISQLNPDDVTSGAVVIKMD